MHNKNMLASILFFFIGFASIAQGSGPPMPSGPTPPPLPIDGGLIVLFIAALVYGIYKVHKMSKRVA